MIMKDEKKKLPRGIHRMPDGRFRLYVTRDGRAHQPLLTWTLLNELRVPVAETRLMEPGLELAKAALIKLQSRIMAEKREGAVAATAAAKVRIGDLFPLIKADYRQRGLKSFEFVEMRWDAHVKRFFGNIVAAELSSDDIQRYIDERLKDADDNSLSRNSTINRELSHVRRMMKLGQRTQPPKVRVIPYFPKLAEPPARQGFLTDERYTKLAHECGAEGLWLRAMLSVASSFAWRESECLNLQVRQLDFPSREIRLDIGATKNNEGRVIKMTNEAHHLLSACAEGKAATDYVFTRGGKRVLDFRAAWEHACERAGCPGLLFHDLRRTAARNLRRLGVAEGVIMKIGGWKTRSVFDRYNIVDPTDLADAARRLDEKRERQVASETASKTASEQEGAEPLVQ
jgi:integrase